MAANTSNTKSQPTRLPGGITNSTRISPLNLLESLSPVHDVVCGWRYDQVPTMPTGNTPASNFAWTVTAVTTTGTASFADATAWPPRHLLTTGTTANDQVVMKEVRTVKKNFLNLQRVIVGGIFRITSTVANAGTAFGLFGGTSVAALGNDQFVFNSSGATLNFVNRNNAGTAVTTAISTALTINTLYGAVAVLNPLASTVSVYFGNIDSLDFNLSTKQPWDLPAVKTVTVATANIPDGTNAINAGFGAQTTAAAAATVEFGPCFAYLF